MRDSFDHALLVRTVNIADAASRAGIIRVQQGELPHARSSPARLATGTKASNMGMNMEDQQAACTSLRVVSTL